MTHPYIYIYIYRFSVFCFLQGVAKPHPIAFQYVEMHSFSHTYIHGVCPRVQFDLCKKHQVNRFEAVDCIVLCTLAFILATSFESLHHLS